RKWRVAGGEWRAKVCGARRPQICHPDRSGPTFSSAPNYGASGRAVEGSAFLLPPDRWSLVADNSPQRLGGPSLRGWFLQGWVPGCPLPPEGVGHLCPTYKHPKKEKFPKLPLPSWGSPHFPVPVREGTVGEEAIPPPGVFVKRVKTKGLRAQVCGSM